MKSNEHIRKQKGKGKQPKVFVDTKDTALELAHSIAEKQEDKSKVKIDRRHGQVAVLKNSVSHKPRTSSKAKLKEVTAALKAQKAQAKREKAKARKQAQKESTTNRDNITDDATKAGSTDVLRKRVSFA